MQFGKIIIVLSLWESSNYVSGFKYVKVLNIRKYAVLNIRRDVIMEAFWIFQDSDNARFLRMQAFAQGSEYAWIWLNNVLWQDSDYVWPTFHRELNKSLVLNMPGLRIWQGCEYTRVIQGAEYVWIGLNMP